VGQGVTHGREIVDGPVGEQVTADGAVEVVDVVGVLGYSRMFGVSDGPGDKPDAVDVASLQ
jgi:hypothetical protein